jgi:hypothetical protein
MESSYAHFPVPNLQEYAIWVVTLLLVAFGFRYAKELIAFVLDKLYDLFVEHHAYQP